MEFLGAAIAKLDFDSRGWCYLLLPTVPTYRYYLLSYLL